MNEQVLWGTSTKGNVYQLHVGRNQWIQVANQGRHLQGFKKVVGGPRGSWGLGCDHLVYVYIGSSDIPIRVQESIWENERWIPIQGWGKKNLLPVDPYGWSNEDGTLHLQRENISLSSDAWVWESEWKVDDNVKGFQTDSEVEPLHVDPMEEPITDLSLGGHDLPNMSQGAASIWITTVSGRVLYRVGVTELCPLGQSWQEIKVDGDEEVVCISAGRQALVWAIAWNGAILARQGVNWQNPKGTAWIQVPMPEHLDTKDKLVQVVAGTNSAWVVSAEGEVWLRKGITAENEVGTGWLKMVNRMKMVTVAGHEKAFGIDQEDRQIYLRSDISSDEPSGKTWKLIDLDFQTLKLLPKSVRNSFSELNDESKDKLQPKEDEAMLLNTSNLEQKSDSNKTEFNITGSESVQNPEIPTKGRDLQAVSDGDLESLLHTDDYFDSVETLGTNFGRLTFSRDTSASDLRLELNSDQEILNNGETESKYLPREGVENTQTDPNAMATQSAIEIKTETIAKNDAEKVNVEWEVSKEGTTETSPTIERHISFKRLRLNFGSSLKSPISVIDKLKTAKPKEFFNDIKSDVKEQKDHILGQMKQAQSVLMGEKKIDKPENIAVSFQKSASVVEEENKLKLTFSQVEDESQAEVSRSRKSSVEKEQMNSNDVAATEMKSMLHTETDIANNATDSTSICSEMSLDNDPWVTYETEVDAGEILWTWVSAGSLNVESDTRLENWFNKGNSQISRYKSEVSQGNWRAKVLSSLREKNLQLFDEYSAYSLAVEISGWNKTGAMKFWQDVHRGHKWVKCNVELAQESQCDASEQAPAANLLITYKWKNQEQGIFLDLKEVIYVQRLKDDSKATIFCIQTADRQRNGLPPHKFCTDAEESMEDWISSLTVACCEQHRPLGAPVAPVMCALNSLGDVFMCQQYNRLSTEDGRNSRFWQQLGGHLKKIECNKQGVRWAIGHNGTAYVYTGSHGGAFFKGSASSSHGIYNMGDTQEMYVYENQRWRLGRGYTSNVIWASYHQWSDETGLVELTKEGTKLPSRHWSWQGEWVVDYKTPGGVDKVGWQYARDFGGTFYPRPRLRAYLRRRRWVRRCRVSTSGPWEEVAPLPLIDLSIQADPVQTSSGDSENQNIAVWAVSSNGDLMARVGVSETNHKGSTWLHVTSDQKFVAVSMGKRLIVWALSQDGGVWCRQGITASTITGDSWKPISPPSKTKLCQISAGDMQVWAVDTKGILWFRDGIAEGKIFGEGWIKVCPDIAHVSVNSDEQVYVIQNRAAGKIGPSEGVLCKRADSDMLNLKDISWQLVTGDGFTYVSARGWLKDDDVPK